MNKIIEISATITICVDTKETAEIIKNALIPETTSSPTDRARVEIRVEGATLFITIHAGDLTALRAAMNSYLSWAWSCKQTTDFVTGQNP